MTCLEEPRSACASWTAPSAQRYKLLCAVVIATCPGGSPVYAWRSSTTIAKLLRFFCAVVHINMRWWLVAAALAAPVHWCGMPRLPRISIGAFCRMAQKSIRQRAQVQVFPGLRYWPMLPCPVLLPTYLPAALAVRRIDTVHSAGGGLRVFVSSSSWAAAPWRAGLAPSVNSPAPQL